MAFKHFLFLGMLIWYAGGCGRKPAQPLAPAFYYWQTTLGLTAQQREYLDETGCKRLYVKVLDVGIDEMSNEAVPYARLSAPDSLSLQEYTLTPVVFITNEVFQRTTTPEKIDWLAGKVAEFQNRLSGFGNPAGPREFQVDCDWTDGTREAFFTFLRVLRSKLRPGACLSATIRLHQYKFPDRRGVPPVDRGMLMCYNTGDIDAVEEENSIFSEQSASKYLKGVKQKYPLPLDLALPVFSWMLVYRGEELWKIIPEAADSLPDGVLTKGTFAGGHYLRPGDVLRRERISPELLKKAARMAAGAGLAEDATLAFFQLDTAMMRAYPPALLRETLRLADSIRINR